MIRRRETGGGAGYSARLITHTQTDTYGWLVTTPTDINHNQSGVKTAIFRQTYLVQFELGIVSTTDTNIIGL